MSALATNIRKLIVRHIEEASAGHVLQLAQRILDDAPAAAGETSAVQPKFERLLRLDENARPVTSESQPWVAVYDDLTKLVWPADTVEGGERPWAESCEAAAAVRLFDAKWWAPTIQQQLSIIDYSRCDPAVDTRFFRGPFGYTWTSTKAAAPSGYAWFVLLGSGDSHRLHQSNHNYVRAVCASQQLGLRF